MYWNLGLNYAKFLRPGLVYHVFCGSRAEVVLRQFLLPDSVERVFEPGAYTLLRPGLVYNLLGIVAPEQKSFLSNFLT